MLGLWLGVINIYNAKRDKHKKDEKRDKYM